MTETSMSPTAEELAALSEPEFLELTRDCDRINAEYDFKRAGIDALGAGAFGALATSAAFSGVPSEALMSALTAIPAAIYVWKGMQDIGQGVRHATSSASADTALRVLYQHQAEPPGTLVRDAEPAGRVTLAQAASASVYPPLVNSR
jgi:hypothetical protein